MPCFGMGLKEKFQSSRRRKSNASTASHTSDSANTESESMAANDISPSKKANRLHDVAGTAKAANPELNAGNSVDTAVSVAPAVTHEVVRPHQHEVVEEQISREIHTHEVHQKIQPIFDVEVRPARHLVPDDNGGLAEVDRPASLRERASEGDSSDHPASDNHKHTTTAHGNTTRIEPSHHTRQGTKRANH
ncbi:hypothetical protein B0T18DRAFT_449087 [Schizothecium vesticola]|uniref:Allergen n=1 Tax=Schizothecium vesticola TaxID=314040 RepID=A0AA40JZ38_9PEZI|nr:hypothetical protein B0T18DRAFT_449087 [Schizothecium vesticola]